jgi:mycothiol synthase
MQLPFWTIDYAYHPEADESLHQHILQWADERARTLLETPNSRPMWFINVFTTQTNRIHDLEHAGFKSQANVGEDSWSKVLMACSVIPSVIKSSLPSGFTIRPLAGEREVEPYVELHRSVFESKSMTVAWRQKTLHRPEYRPDLDLVVVAPDGRLAGFYICWLDVTNKTGQIEPLGVHSDFRNLGLARAILLEGMRRLYSHSATQLCVETDNYRNAAFNLYESVGFQVIHDVLVYRKDYQKPQ